MTKEELIMVLNTYFEPMFKIFGAIAALAVMYAAYWLVIKPFFRGKR